ncbi:MAG: DUF4260 domain-containing protein [Cryobacterium sp.]|nr:DUF4260 domain-containing protein [Cryobacterium sp.]
MQVTLFQELDHPTEPRHDHTSPAAPQGLFNPRATQQLEGALIGALAIVGTIVIAPQLWWFPLAVFLAFDLSALGYLHSTRIGAACYNAIHTYAWPAALGAAALLSNPTAPDLAQWLALIALAWAFHVGIDRMLGYGLKHRDHFTHTHLGPIGRSRRPILKP